MKKLIGAILALGSALAATYLGMPFWMMAIFGVVGIILMFS